MTKYRYTIILEREGDEDYGPEAEEMYGKVAASGTHDGSDLAARTQVATELQEAMDESGLPVGSFDVISREKVD